MDPFNPHQLANSPNWFSLFTNTSWLKSLIPKQNLLSVFVTVQFIMGYTVDFRAILNESSSFTTLDENSNARANHSCASSCDAMHRVRKSEAFLPVVYEPFLSLIIGPRLEHMFESSFRLLLRILK